MTQQMAFDIPDFSEIPQSLRIRDMGAIRKITWSYSRRGALEQCARRYYYAYYGSNKRTKTEDVEARLLNRLQNRYERSGQILHLVISTFLRKTRAGDLWNTSSLCNWAESLFSKDCDRSRQITNLVENGESDTNSMILQEFYYKESDAEETCLAAKNRLVSATKEFAENPVFSELRGESVTSDALIECPIKIDGFPCKVSGRVDLAYRDGDEIKVVDWKMGGTQVGDDSLQLATYGTWAINRFGANPDNVCIYKALLADGELSTSRITEGMLSRAKARIIQDAERMAALDNYGHFGIVGAFSPCSQPAVCALCRFRKICE